MQMNAYPTASVPASQDRIGQAIRRFFGSRYLYVGLLAAVATILFAWAAVMLVGLIPSDAIVGAFDLQLREELVTTDVPADQLVIQSLLGPWGGDQEYHLPWADPGGGVVVWSTGLRFFPLIVLTLVFAGVGLAVRGLVAPRLWPRFCTLLVATITSAVLLAILAAALGHSVTIGTNDYTVDVSYVAGSFFWRGLLLTFILGAFSYGVVGALPAYLSTSLWRAAVVVVVPFVLVGVLAPAFVASGTAVYRAREGESPSVYDTGAAFGQAARLSAGTGAASLPLALGAKATFEAGSSFSPLHSGYVPGAESGGDVFRWAKLQHRLEASKDGRIMSYADPFGFWGKLAAVIYALLIVCLWVVVVIDDLRRKGAPKALDGLVAEVVTGLCAAVLFVLVGALATQKVGIPGSASQLTSMAWGVTGSAYTQTFFELLGIAVVVGILYAALRPSPRQLPAPAIGGWLRKLDRVLPKEGAPPIDGAPVAAPAAASGPPSVDAAAGGKVPMFCPKCGATYPAKPTKFCRSCGAERKTGTPEESPVGQADEVSPTAAPMARPPVPHAPSTAESQEAPLSTTEAATATPRAAEPATAADEPATALEPPDAAKPRIDPAEAIRKFAALRDEGLITDEEFEKKKKQLLDEV